MNDSERIGQIQQAVTMEQLEQATQGYRQQAMAAHPALQHNQAFQGFLDEGQFLRALDNVRRARLSDGDEYLDVIRVLQFAATRQLAIKML